MAEEVPVNSGETRRRTGRPTKAEATARALGALGVDPALVDPLRILAAIAGDEAAPPTARVAACKVLLGQRQGSEDAPVAAVQPVGAISIRALELLKAARGH